MKNNRRAILPQLGLKQTSSNYLKNFLRTEGSEDNIDNLNEENNTKKESDGSI